MVRNLIQHAGVGLRRIHASYMTDDLLAQWIEDARQEVLKHCRRRENSSVSAKRGITADDSFAIMLDDDENTIEEAYCLTIYDILRSREHDDQPIERIHAWGYILDADHNRIDHWIVDVQIQHDAELV